MHQLQHLHQRTCLWLEALVREGRLYSWLQRLYWAELGGARRFQEIVTRWRPSGTALEAYEGIIADEFRHADLIKALLDQHELPLLPAPTSERYWDPVWGGITSFEDACAAGTRGEMLARNRFRVMIKHPVTPQAICELLMQILPDEVRHAKLLGEMAGNEAMKRMHPHHLEGMAALGL